MQGRNTQGVRLISVNDDEHLVSVSRVDESANGEEGDVEAAVSGDAPEAPGTTIH